MFLDFYRLQQQPFGVTPDPAFLYPSQTHCEALDSLTDGILGGRGFLALIAEPGMGKTTLLYQVLEGLRDTARAAYLFQTQCDSREFFQYLLSELGVDTQAMGLVGMHNKLNEMLFAEMLAGKRFVLVVDEAQNLADPVLETVRLLSDFETSHTKLLQNCSSRPASISGKTSTAALGAIAPANCGPKPSRSAFTRGNSSLYQSPAQGSRLSWRAAFHARGGGRDCGIEWGHSAEHQQHLLQRFVSGPRRRARSDRS
jgi:AAA domain